MIFSNKEIKLRYCSEHDIGIIHNEYFSDLESAKYLSRSVHDDVSKTNSLLTKLSIEGSLEEFGKSIWVVARIKDDRPVGVITLVADESTIELHIGILKNERSKGLASKSLGLTAKYCLDNNLAKDVVSFTDISHVAAQQAFLNAGFQKLGVYPDYYNAPRISASKRDVYYYKYKA